MKKRLLSLLLAMAMIVSMVPFQALAEEPDETPALLETAEGIAPEDETTEVTIPETTEETVPETTEETAPETTEETVPETTEETVPETTEETVPETTEETVPETTEETVPEVTEALIPEEAAVIPEGSDNLAPEGEEEEDPSFNITFPPSARKIVDGFPVLTAGQKLNLSTSLSKADAKKGIKWMVVYGEALDTGEPVSALSLDEIRPEGAAVDGAQWDSIASISEKGVLRTNAAVTAESYIILVEAISNDKNVGYGLLPVLIQPPVEAFNIDAFPVSELSTSDEPAEPSAVPNEGGVNRNYPYPAYYDISDGPFVLFTPYSQPFVPYNEVKWNIGKNATVQTLEKYIAEHKDVTCDEGEIEWLMANNAVVVTPKAPGKLKISAACTDGGGAKVSAVMNVHGYVDHVSISTPENFDDSQPLHPGETLKLSATAYYDEDEQYPISGGKYSWYVFDRYGAGDDFATIDKNGKLTITNKVTRPATLHVECYYETKIDGYTYGYDAYIDTIQVAPSNERTLALAAKYSEPGYTGYDIIHTAFPWHAAPGDKVEIVPVWVDANGNVIIDDSGLAEPVKNVNYKVSGSACSFDKNTGILTFKKVGTTKITATATLDGKTQSFTCTFRGVYFTDGIQIQNKPDSGIITVVGGKSLSLKAINYSGKKKATEQKVDWDINKEEFGNRYHDDVYNYCWIKPDTGKLTTYPVTEDYYVTVTAQPADLIAGDWENRPTDTVTIHIIPEKTQYRTKAYIRNDNWNVYLTGEEQTLRIGPDFGCTVESYGRYKDFRPTDVISSNPKIATVVKDNGSVTGIKIPADAKPGKVTFTVKGLYLDGYDDQDVEIWKDAPSAKFTINLVKPVTEIAITRPTNKDGSFVPAYVGKSLKLTAKVNKDATNKKLDWNVLYYNGDPEGEFDGSKLVELAYYDKTTVKNGVLKIDKSWYSEGRCYAVWAASQDGYFESDPVLIQAYGMTGSIEIRSAGEFDVDHRGYESLDKVNNHTITIEQGEEVQFEALVYDVTGNRIDCYEEDIYDDETGEIIGTEYNWWNHGANPDVDWTISGKKGIVSAVDNYEGFDTLNVVGLKPGTVTVKVSANDGSKKTATFKIEVVAPAET